MDDPKRLRMFAGPNGSGKTSLVRKLAKEYSPDGLFHLGPFINADDILSNLTSGQGVDVGLFGMSLSKEELAAKIRAMGRLPNDHPLLSRIELIENRLQVPSNCCDAYAAAALADVLREEAMTARISFSFETVMSHPSKVDFFARARSNAYRTYLYFIATESPSLNIHRVGTRTELGGHDVPPEKVVGRYHRTLALVASAMQYAFRAFLFDNSGPEPIWLAEVAPDGSIDYKVPRSALPKWFIEHAMSP